MVYSIAWTWQCIIMARNLAAFTARTWVKSTSKGSALLIMGVVGGAVTPLLYGIISDASNPQIAYWILIPFYLFILLFCSTQDIKQGRNSIKINNQIAYEKDLFTITILLCKPCFCNDVQ